MPQTDLTDHLVAGTERQLKPNTSPHHLAIKAEKKQLGDTHMTYDKTWKIEQVRSDQSTDRGCVPRHERMATKHGAMSIIKFEVNTKHRCHPNFAVMLPDIEVPHTPCDVLMR